MAKVRSIIKYTLSFVLAGVMVYFAFSKVDWVEFMNGLRQTRWGWVALFVWVALLVPLFRELRMVSMLRAFDPSITSAKVWNSVNIGNLINTILPGAGEVVRSTYVVTERLTFSKSLGAVACERIFDIIFILILLIVSLAFGSDSFTNFMSENIVSRLSLSTLWVALAVILLLTIILVVVFKYRDRSSILDRVASAFKGIGDGVVVFKDIDGKGAFLLWNALLWCAYIGLNFLMFKAIPQLSHLGLVDAIFIAVIANVSSVVPVPGGVGAYHYFVALVLQALYLADWNMGMLYATMCHEINAIVVIVLGLISWIVPKRA